MKHPSPNLIGHASGFSLVEQMVTLTLAAILMAAAIPTLANLATRSAVQVTADKLFTAARTARSIAIMHNTHVLLCPSADEHHCSGSSHWQQGWIVAMDHNHDNLADAHILTTDHVDTPHVRIIGSRGRKYVRFRANGAAAGTNLSLLVCPSQTPASKASVVVISNSGRIRQSSASKAQRARCKTGNHP